MFLTFRIGDVIVYRNMNSISEISFCEGYVDIICDNEILNGTCKEMNVSKDYVEGIITDYNRSFKMKNDQRPAKKSVILI